MNGSDRGLQTEGVEKSQERPEREAKAGRYVLPGLGKTVEFWVRV